MCLRRSPVSGAEFRVAKRFLVNGSRLWAGVAQLVEHLICNQRVGGSNPFASSTEGRLDSGWNGYRFWVWRWEFHRRISSSAAIPLRCMLRQAGCGPGGAVCAEAASVPVWVGFWAAGFEFARQPFGPIFWFVGWLEEEFWRAVSVRRNGWAQVAERLMAADCKSATHSSYGGSNPPLCTIRQWSGSRCQGSVVP